MPQRSWFKMTTFTDQEGYSICKRAETRGWKGTDLPKHEHVVTQFSHTSYQLKSCGLGNAAEVGTSSNKSRFFCLLLGVFLESKGETLKKPMGT